MSTIEAIAVIFESPTIGVHAVIHIERNSYHSFSYEEDAVLHLNNIYDVAYFPTYEQGFKIGRLIGSSWNTYMRYIEIPAYKEMEEHKKSLSRSKAGSRHVWRKVKNYYTLVDELQFPGVIALVLPYTRNTWQFVLAKENDIKTRVESSSYYYPDDKRRKLTGSLAHVKELAEHALYSDKWLSRIGITLTEEQIEEYRQKRVEYLQEETPEKQREEEKKRGIYLIVTSEREVISCKTRNQADTRASKMKNAEVVFAKYYGYSGEIWYTISKLDD